MKVYRVEHKITGQGPYNEDWGTEVTEPCEYGLTYGGRFELCEAHANEDHPSAWWDVQFLNEDREYRCGFLYMTDLFTWFGGWLPVILRTGRFRVAVYDVPEHLICLGSRQVTFYVGELLPLE